MRLRFRIHFLVPGLLIFASGAAAQPPADSGAAIVRHTCSQVGTDCNSGNRQVIVLRSNSEEVARYALPKNAATANSDETFLSQNAAGYQFDVLAPGAIAAGFGYGLPLATATKSADTIPLPTSLAGTTVTVTDSAGDARLAPLFYVSPGQINYLIPSDSKPGHATVRVVSGAGAVSNGSLNLDTAAPGLFSMNSSGEGVVAATMVQVKPDGSQVPGVVFQYDGAQSKYVTLPIEPWAETDQMILTLYGTGFRNRSDLSAVQVRIDGVDSEVLYAGNQGDYVGLDQLNVRLPYMLGGRGDMEIELMVDGQAANVVTVATGGPLIAPRPLIASLTPNTAAPGQSLSPLTITGQRLDGVAALEFLPPAGITISNLAGTSTAVTAQIAVAADAATGTRQVSVRTPAGRSNRVAFTITSPGPRITAVSPDTGQPGQTLSLTIAGDNLSGVTAVQFAPPTGITVGNLAASANMVSLQVSIAADAAAGARSVQVVSSLGTSNAVTFTVAQAKPQIVSLSQTEANAGQTIQNFVITGQNLAGVTSIVFTPPTGLTVGALTVTATTVTTQLTIAASAHAQLYSVALVSTAGLSNSLSFYILQPGPHITSLNSDSGEPGQTIAFALSGQDLAGVTAIVFSPSTGITVTGLAATATTVTAQVTIAATAPTGPRTVSVVSPGGASNTLPFTVETPAPQITSLNPNHGDTGAAINLTITGQNLSGVTGIAFSPSNGITVSGMAATAGTVTASVTIASSAAVGSRSVAVTSPAGTSNALTFTVNQSLSPVPVISNVVLDVPSSAGIVVTISGHLNFTDGAGDLVYTGSEAGSAKLKFSATTPSAGCTMSSYGSFLNKPGQTSGTIDFSLTISWNTKIMGSFAVKVSLVDGAGHESNVVSVSPGTWYCRAWHRDRDPRPLELVPEAVAARGRDREA